MTDGQFNAMPGSDDVVVSSSQNWFQRIFGGFVATLIGVVLVVGAGILLFWNEGRSAATIAALDEGARTVISAPVGQPDAANEGKLVHVAGATQLGGPAHDADFGFEAAGLRLERLVEMYQWKEESHSETQKKLGGGEETVTHYTYSKEWSDRRINSDSFHSADGHRNPAAPAVSSKAFFAQQVKLAGYKVGDNVLELIPANDGFAVPDSALSKARAVLGDRASIASGGVYAGADPGQPRVGDVRISWKLLPPGDISVVGRQSQGALTTYLARNGHELLLAESGLVDADVMFKHGQEENRVLTWILRAVGTVLMLIGFAMSLSLLSILADIIPLFGSIVGAGTFLIALLCTVVLAPLIIAVAWVVYRPLVAVGAVAAAIILGWVVHSLASRRVRGLPGVVPKQG